MKITKKRAISDAKINAMRLEIYFLMDLKRRLQGELNQIFERIQSLEAEITATSDAAKKKHRKPKITSA